MLDKYDNFWLNASDGIALRLSKLTGLSPSRLAYRVLPFLAGVLIFIFALGLATDNGVFSKIVYTFAIWATYDSCKDDRKMLKIINNMVEGEAEPILPARQLLTSFQLSRIWHTLFGIVFCFFVIGWVFFIYGFVLYIGSDFGGPQKSLYSRAKAKVKAFKLPSIAVLPKPIPTFN